MQATVRTFDPGTRCGSVFLDDGAELGFDADAFDAGPLRLLRPGQRVNIAVAGGRIAVITLSTFPLPEGPFPEGPLPERPLAEGPSSGDPLPEGG